MLSVMLGMALYRLSPDWWPTTNLRRRMNFCLCLSGVIFNWLKMFLNLNGVNRRIWSRRWNYRWNHRWNETELWQNVLLSLFLFFIHYGFCFFIFFFIFSEKTHLYCKPQVILQLHGLISIFPQTLYSVLTLLITFIFLQWVNK